MVEAVHWVEEARTMDLADRYLNCKAAKYMLRAGMIDKAEEACALFTRVSSGLFVGFSLSSVGLLDMMYDSFESVWFRHL